KLSHYFISICVNTLATRQDWSTTRRPGSLFLNVKKHTYLHDSILFVYCGRIFSKCSILTVSQSSLMACFTDLRVASNTLYT
ncbi:hypothetical protein IRJ41_012645, partial [Triplophysa rosa]